MGRRDGVVEWVGRDTELAVLARAVEALRRGEGSVAWVEGEPGIGKSALVTQALAAADPEWDIGWGTAGPLSQRLPLGVMQDCLGVRLGSDDQRRARVAGMLHDQRRGLFAASNTPTARIEELLALVDKLCADTPVVMVIDDVQWADDESLIAWHQLASSVGQLPLLLIVTARPTARAEVRELRLAVERRGAAVIGLGPLPDAEVAELVTQVLGAPPGDGLRRLTAQAGGNPLYLRELVDALVREDTVRVGPDSADVPDAAGKLPVSLTAVLEDRLTSVSEETGQLLRTAALLGSTFSVTDLAVLLGKPAWTVADSVREAASAGILVDSGPGLSFRHALLQQALYERMPEALRSALHAEGARELAAHGGDALSVAQQLSMAGPAHAGSDWTYDWLTGAAPAIITRAPRLAADLLRSEAAATAPGTARGELLACLVLALTILGEYEDAASTGSKALAEISDPVRLAETYAVLARAQANCGQGRQAIATLRRAQDRESLPPAWRARLLAMRAMVERGETGELEETDAAARQALAIAEDCGDAFASAHALSCLWLSHGVRRDHAAALAYIDRALDVLGDDSAYRDLRSFAYDGRVFTLQSLGRWSDAEQTMRQAMEVTRRDAEPSRGSWTAAAVHWYWTGQWDDALAELDPGEQDVPGLRYTYLREGWPPLLAHGVTALIAGRRDQRTTARRHLRQGQAQPVQRLYDRENRDFLVAAHALALEQSGDTAGAMRQLESLARRAEGEMTLVFQWLPDLVRLALAAGEPAVARFAAQASEAEARAETVPGRAATAALRCAGLLRSDPGPLREAVARYTEAGPAVEEADARVDLAVVLAAHGEDEEARAVLHEAVGLYEGLGAYWDIRRAEGRLRAFGIRRGARGRRGPRPASGWEALTPTELKIAALIGSGQATSQIADGMFLSRRTVQKHVSNILAKLGAKSRVEIVREVLNQGITA